MYGTQVMRGVVRGFERDLAYTTARSYNDRDLDLKSLVIILNPTYRRLSSVIIGQARWISHKLDIPRCQS